MVSGWTPILLYQGLDGLSKALEGTPLGIRANTLKTRIKNDYEKHIMADDVPAGFVVFEKDHVDYLLHPRDKNTGLKLRLLPLTRSIIAEFIDSHQANYHNTLIEQHLKHPDGVRLMDTFVTYKGGEKTYFQRGETAANVGREIGILYVHAHIRYIEAMAKLGRADEAFEALFTINPISIKNHVKNAGLRQANTYFSSSDAAFLDRYEAKENFNLVKSGQVEVKAGWRLYSSGPGIYIHQMISHVFGIDRKSTRLNPSHVRISYAVFCLKKKKKYYDTPNSFNDNFSNICSMVIAYADLNANSSHSDFYQYFFVSEYSTAHRCVHFNSM